MLLAQKFFSWMLRVYKAVLLSHSLLSLLARMPNYSLKEPCQDAPCPRLFLVDVARFKSGSAESEFPLE
jgi:hypothetical protein